MAIHQICDTLAPRVFGARGYYRFSAPADPAVAWCELDEAGDVAIYASEADARSARRPLIRVSKAWFSDIVAEKVASPLRQLPRWKRVLARLDQRGATFAAVEGRPGWFVAAWFEPAYPTPDGGPWEQYFRPGQPIYGSKAMLKAVARRVVAA